MYQSLGNKPLNRTERRQKQQTKAAYETIHIPDVPGRPKLDLSAEFLEALKNIPKVEHQKLFLVIKGKCVNCGRTDNQTNDWYYRLSDHCVNAVFKDENPDPNDDSRDLSVSIDDPKFSFIFLESFNEYLSQEKLMKENFEAFQMER
jgi:hypothetical protein